VYICTGLRVYELAVSLEVGTLRVAHSADSAHRDGSNVQPGGSNARSAGVALFLSGEVVGSNGSNGSRRTERIDAGPEKPRWVPPMHCQLPAGTCRASETDLHADSSPY
jgi:hypothetical protein